MVSLKDIGSAQNSIVTYNQSKKLPVYSAGFFSGNRIMTYDLESGL